jgi:hypothetical protein
MARVRSQRSLLPLLWQVGITAKSNGQGALADTIDTSGTVAYLSPALTGVVITNLRAYGFPQFPIYSQLGGYRLFPRNTATAGLSYHF